MLTFLLFVDEHARNKIITLVLTAKGLEVKAKYRPVP